MEVAKEGSADVKEESTEVNVLDEVLNITRDLLIKIKMNLSNIQDVLIDQRKLEVNGKMWWKLRCIWLKVYLMTLIDWKRM